MNSVPQTLPNRTIRWRRRLVICLALIASAGIACVALGRFARSRDPFREKYENIRLGMTGEEVKDLLGPPWIPTCGFDINPISSGEIYYSWWEAEEHDRMIWVLIYFDQNDRTSHVTEKGFSPKTRLEEIEEELVELTKKLTR